MRKLLCIGHESVQFFIVLATIVMCSSGVFGQEKFSRNALVEDLQFVHSKYERSHPNLYRYVSESQLDAVFNTLESQIKDSMTEMEFYNHIRALSLFIRDGHTSITLSKKTLSNQFKKKKFPFEIKKLNEDFFIVDNYTNDSTISRGDHLLEINGQKLSEIYATILDRQTRDGYNQTFPEWSVQNWFMAKFGLNYGYPEKFDMLLKDESGIEYKRTVNAISVDSMRIQYQLKYGDEYVKAPSGRGIYLHKLNDEVYVLKIKTFSSSILRKRYKQRFRKSIRAIFKEIQRTNPKKLLIDLRGNLGGESTNGNYLLSYLIKKPYDIVECTDMVRRKEGKDDRIIKNKGLRLRIRMAKKWNKSIFEGKIYTMINGGSFSCSGIVASNLERYTDCQFIGQETGGNATRMSGAGETEKLPNTKIRIKIPVTRYTIRPESELTNHGVYPDFNIKLEKDQLLSFEDEELKLALKWIMNQ